MTNKEAIVNQLELLKKELEKESGNGAAAHATALKNLIKTMKKDYGINK